MRSRSSAGWAAALLCLFWLTGCQPGVSEYYYLEAKRIEEGPELSLTITYVRRYETQKWCEAEKESLLKEGEFTASCSFENALYQPMFEGEAAGRWYTIQRVGAFPPSVVFYEFDPPLPDAMMIHQLKNQAPHILQFAALHQAPAEVRIFSPDGKELDISG